MVLAAVLSASGAQAQTQNSACLEEAVGGSVNCTANDVEIASIEVTEITEACTSPTGDTMTFSGLLNIVTNATERYDLGFYLGPNPRSSTNNDCIVTVIDPDDLTPPQDGDNCGDAKSAIDTQLLVTGLTVPCADTDGDGFFDVNTCSTWRQNASNADCAEPDDALPGTKSKCNCDIANTDVQVPEPDPQCITNADCVEDGNVCTGQVCDPADPNANDFGCVFPFTTQVCRASTGVCDPAESCTGSSATCPADVRSTSVCRASTGVCDVAETCNGTDANCPADQFSTSVCRASAGVCDVAETCTGSGASCPADQFSTSQCRASAGVCDVAETCTGNSADCPADQFSTSVCRASAGVCDVAETCTGSGASCPADQFSTSVCRASAGVCDVAETCTGSGASCPADQFSTSVCRASAGVCDVAETCTGSGASCPADQFSTSQCRASAGICDVAETCTGSGASCPADQFSTSQCRASAGVCDVAEVCTGSGASCPADDFVDAGTTCRTSSGECDVAEQCTGTSASCPADGDVTDGTQCTTDNNVCTNDVCIGGECVHQNNTVSCDDGLFCTIEDVCVNGQCAGGEQRVCGTANECALATCDEENDICTDNPVDELCDDDNECTVDTCGVEGCINENICDGLICRTAGFWSTHGGNEAKGKKSTTTNATQTVIDAVGPLQVCGQSISTTSSGGNTSGDLSSALEALCVSVQGEQIRQLYRQLVAAALNCAISGGGATCDDTVGEELSDLVNECSDVCEGTAGEDALSIGECIDQLDCFNNGGEFIEGGCALGTCATDTETLCGGDYGSCPDINGLPQPCEEFPGNCHDADLCNEEIDICPATGPASSSGACRAARDNECTIDSCD